MQLFFYTKITTVAGRESPCNCLDAACSCFEIDQFLATNVMFNSISSIAVTPDSVLYIADQGNVRLRAVSSRYVYLFCGTVTLLKSLYIIVI